MKALVEEVQIAGDATNAATAAQPAANGPVVESMEEGMDARARYWYMFISASSMAWRPMAKYAKLKPKAAAAPPPKELIAVEEMDDDVTADQSAGDAKQMAVAPAASAAEEEMAIGMPATRPRARLMPISASSEVACAIEEKAKAQLDEKAKLAPRKALMVVEGTVAAVNADVEADQMAGEEKNATAAAQAIAVAKPDVEATTGPLLD